MAKVTEYPRITKLKDDDVLLVDGPDGTRTILQKDAAKQMGGEVIMVSKTAGDATKVTINTTDEEVQLATIEDLKPVAEDVGDLKESIYNAITFAADGGYNTLDLSDKKDVNRLINGSHKWAAVSGSATACVYSVPFGIKKFRIQGNANGYFAFLKSLDNMDTVGTLPDFCTGYTKRIAESADSPAEYVVDDCRYIWAYLTNSSGTDISLTSIECASGIVNDTALSDAEERINTRFLTDIELPDSALVSGIIQDSGKWATTSPAKGWMIPLTEGTLCRIKATVSNDAIIAFLRSDTIEHNAMADFSTYTKSRIVIPATDAETYTIPPDATYIYIAQKSTAGTNLTPEKTEFDVWKAGDIETDKTLTVSDKAADAEVVGEKLSEINNRLVISPIDTSTLEYEWRRGRISPSGNNAGQYASNSYYCMEEAFINASLLPDRFVYCGPRQITKSGTTAQVNLIVHEYRRIPTETDTSGYLRRQILDDMNNVYTRNPDCLYIRFSIGSVGGTVLFYEDDAASCFAISTAPKGDIFDALFSGMDWKTSMILARARQVTSVRFDPLAALPNQNGDYTPGTEYMGVPYSSPRALDTYVGINVSMDTFCTALKNPRSVLYKRQSLISNSKTYYGMVCSSLADYLLGLAAPINTFTMGDSPDFEERDFYAMKPGYVFVNSAHAYLIYDIRRDKYGRPLSIGIVEAAPPRVFYNAYSISSLRQHLSSHPGGPFKLYEFVGNGDVDYRPCKYVAGYPDEIVETTYPDIMTEYGDLAVVPAGTDVTINVIDGTGYSEINVYRYEGSRSPDALRDSDFEAVAGMSGLSVADFVLHGADVEYGVWRIVMSGDGKSSETRFIAVDMNCEYDTETHRAKFSSENATPIYINAYDDMVNYAKADMRNFHRLTADDITAGASESGFDASEIVTEDYPYIRIEFQTDWGQAVWRSKPFTDPQAWAEYSV